MTGFLGGSGSSNQLSRITIATLEDLGYGVNYTTADRYTRADVNPACTCNRRGLQSNTSISSKKHSMHELGTSREEWTQRRREISEEAHTLATEYGRSVLKERHRRHMKQPSTALSFSDGIRQNVSDDIVYVGYMGVIVFFEENGEFYDVMVTP